MGWLRHDLSYALRSLARRPGFTAVAVLTLALGFGANTAIFSVVRGVLLRPLPYPHEDRLVSFWYHSQGRRTPSFSQPELLDLRNRKDILESVAGYTFRRPHLGSGGEPRLIRTVEATHDLLPLLGVPPSAGRFFTEEETLPDGPPIVVIGDRLRRQIFAGREEVVGEAVVLNGASHTVIGVMPEGFSFPDPEVDAYRPFRFDPARPDRRNNHYLRAVGRLRSEVAVEAARAQVVEYGRWAAIQYPEFYSGFNISFDLSPLRETFVGSSKTPLLILLGAVSLVLLIACANVANLLLARSEERRREVAVRLALGASTHHLARQLLVESALLAVLGAAVGLPLAWACLKVLVSLTGDALPRVDEIRIDLAVLAYTLAAALITGFLFGLAPLLRARRADLRSDLHDGLRTVSAGRSGLALRRGLVAGQVALAVVLATGTMLMTRTILALRDIDVGFDTESAVALRLSLPGHIYVTPASIVGFAHEIEERARSLPGVSGAGIVEFVPLLQGFNNNLSLQIEGRIAENIGDAPTAMIRDVTPGAAAALGLRLKAGRFMTAEDVSAGRPVAVVNEAFARAYLAGTDPLAARVRMYDPDQKWMEVVGVVQDFRQWELVGDDWPQMMVPLDLADECSYEMPTDFSLLVRAGAGLESLIDPLRRLVHQTGPAVAIRDVRTLAQARRDSVGDRAVLTPLLGVAAALALFLSCLGLYGVISLWVGQRRREIGLRLALGASRAEVRRLVVVQAGAPVGAGLGVGLAVAIPLAWLLRGLLHQVPPTDPVSILLVIGVLAGAAWLSAAVPARRATRVDPASTLRSE